MASTGKLVKSYSVRWGNADASGIYSNTGESYTSSSSSPYTYTDIPSSTINFTSSITGGIYLLRCDLACYLNPDNGNGANAAFKFNGNKICGVDGSSGDAWQRLGHGSGGGGSGSLCRMFIHSPALSAGTSISANVMIANWGTSVTVNYGGYSTFSEFYVMEFEAT